MSKKDIAQVFVQKGTQLGSGLPVLRTPVTRLQETVGTGHPNKIHGPHTAICLQNSAAGYLEPAGDRAEPKGEMTVQTLPIRP